MKIKLDFVTNSSSTSYIFIYRGKEENDLFKIMKNNWMHFEYPPCYSDDKPINVYEIIEYMKEKGYLSFLSITDHIKVIKQEIRSLKKLFKKQPDYTYLEQDIYNREKMLELLNYKKTKGYKFTATAGFSDHDFGVGLILRSTKMNHDLDGLRVTTYEYE